MTKFSTKAALAATVATALFATPAFAAEAPFTATARIVSPLLIEKNADLNFGTITMLPLLTSSDVVVGRAGGNATDCGDNLTCTAPTAASFTVTGSLGQGLTVSTSALTALTSGSSTVAFAIDAPTLVTLGATGDATPGEVSFEIGGTITVTDTTVDGTYTGDVDVTVEYS